MLIKQKLQKHKKLAILTAVVLALGLVFAGLEVSGKTSFILNNQQEVVEEEAKTTSTAPTAQEDFSDGDDRQPNQTTPNEGVLTDNNGTISSVAPRNNWSLSPDGKITVYSPAQNSLITNGQEISGTTTYQKVNFRLIDDVSGVIMEGNMAVVNGQFSGKLNFDTTGTNGRLDIFYSTNAGAESSNTEIAVRFK